METSWTDYFMPIAMGIIMFGIGINLRFSDFKRVITRPRAAGIGLFAQLIMLPLVAFAIIYFWKIDPLLKVGVVLIAACPGGSLSNFVTYLLRGNVALSVSLTAINSFIILFTIPLVVNLGMLLFMRTSASIGLSIGDTFLQVLLGVVLPVLAGITFNELTSEKITDDLNGILRYLIIGLMITMVIVVLFFSESKRSINFFENLNLLIPLVMLNISTMGIGFLMGRYNKLSHENNYTIAIEVGLQNSALAIYIANEVIEKSEMAMVAVMYGSFSLLSTLGAAFLLKRFAKDKTIFNHERKKPVD